MTLCDPHDWWVQAERVVLSPASPASEPAWMKLLTDAHAAELSFRLDDAELCLKQLADAPLEGPWVRIRDVIAARLLVRRSRFTDLALARQSIDDLFSKTPDDERGTRARLHHLAAVIALRLARLEEAEASLIRALQLVEESPSRVWMLDGLGQVFAGYGAWEESRRTFRWVIDRKTEIRDYQGIAISGGGLGRMEMRLGNCTEAMRIARQTLEICGQHLSANARLRLQTLILEACLGLNDRRLATLQAVIVEQMLGQIPAEKHYLCGFACLGLARAAAMAADDLTAERWFADAETHFTLPEHLALLNYWKGRLVPGLAHDPQWHARMAELFAAGDGVMDAEVLTHLFLARGASQRADRDRMRQHLLHAFQRATVANNAMLAGEVDRAYAELDPPGLSERLVERYTGRAWSELRQTVREEVTVIFADLVNFTPRSIQLPPEDVMRTLRSLFELMSPVLSRHAIQPITHMGDGLLAVARGAGHRQRGLAFARELIRKSLRVTFVRQIMGEPWGMQIRAGVASGPVVLGTLGSQLKTEFAAIGLTTNLAARLQGQAKPAEVVWADAPGAATPAPASAGDREMVQLKGFEHPIAINRELIAL